MSVAAVVLGEPVTTDEVAARLEQVRASAFGARLPGADTADGRNARRWVTQLICAERLVDAALGAAVHRSSGSLTVERSLAVGGVAAAVLAARPDAVRVVPVTEPGEAEIRSYYERNSDLYADRNVPLAEARPVIANLLRQARTDRAFSDWLDAGLREHVTLLAGYEHPADPHHADATHRH